MPYTAAGWKEAALAMMRQRSDMRDKLARIRDYCEGMKISGRRAECAADIISIIDEA